MRERRYRRVCVETAFGRVERTTKRTTRVGRRKKSRRVEIGLMRDYTENKESACERISTVTHSNG